jgi:hypothetical protein
MLRAIGGVSGARGGGSGRARQTRFADGAELRVKERFASRRWRSGSATRHRGRGERRRTGVVHGGRLGSGRSKPRRSPHRVAFVVAALAASAPVTVRGADDRGVGPGFC